MAIRKGKNAVKHSNKKDGKNGSKKRNTVAKEWQNIRNPKKRQKTIKKCTNKKC